MSGKVRQLKELVKTLDGEWVRNDGKFSYWLVPGAPKQVPIPIKASTELAHTHYALVADALGWSTPDVRDAIESPVPKRGGRGQGNAPPAPEPTITRTDALDALVEVREAVGEVERGLRSGQRDAAYYRHVIASTRAAAAELRRPMRGQQGHDDSPPLARVDDSKFKPTSVDPLLTGPARVTGETARAVRRRNGTTKWEHDGRRP